MTAASKNDGGVNQTVDGKRKRKLVYGWNYLNWGGSQVYMLALIKLAQHEYDVHLVVPHATDPTFLNFLHGLEARVHYFSPPYDAAANSFAGRLKRRRNKFQSETAMTGAIERIAESDSIVHLDLAPQQAFTTLLRVAKKYTVFTTLHNSFARHSPFRELLWTAYLRMLMRFPNFRIFAGNRDARSYLCEYLPKKHWKKVVVTSTAINPAEVESALALNSDRKALLAKAGVPDDKFVVLTVGQFIDRKGRWVLLDAARRVLSTREDTVFVWIMPTLPDAPTMEKIEEFGLGGRFFAIRSATIANDRISLLEFVKLADIFVLPSIVEGLPIAMLEAMALGVPTLSTRINAIPEAIIDGETGLLASPGDAVELSRKINELLDDGELRKYLSKNGREFVCEAFDERKVATIALKEYGSTYAKSAA